MLRKKKKEKEENPCVREIITRDARAILKVVAAAAADSVVYEKLPPRLVL